MSTLTGRTFNDVLRKALEAVPQYAHIDEVDDAFMQEQSAAEFLDFAGRERRNAIRRGLTRLGRAKVGDIGYKEIALFDASDYDLVIRHRIKQGHEFHAKARALAAECLDVHGVEINVEQIIAQLKAA